MNGLRPAIPAEETKESSVDVIVAPDGITVLVGGRSERLGHSDATLPSPAESWLRPGVEIHQPQIAQVSRRRRLATRDHGPTLPVCMIGEVPATPARTTTRGCLAQERTGAKRVVGTRQHEDADSGRRAADAAQRTADNGCRSAKDDRRDHRVQVTLRANQVGSPTRRLSPKDDMGGGGQRWRKCLLPRSSAFFSVTCLTPSQPWLPPAHSLAPLHFRTHSLARQGDTRPAAA